MAIVAGDNTSNILTGTGGADSVTGRAGADTIGAGGGNDRVNGGEGADSVEGGDGDDILRGFDGSDLTEASQRIEATLVGQGFTRVVFASAAPGDPDRLYVLEQYAGRISILDPSTGTTLATPFLDLPQHSFSQNGEQGLLGLAFHPDYARNGKFYIYVNNAEGDIEVRRYFRSNSDPDRAAGQTGNVILTIERQEATNHNGGWMGFGPDGMLYISVGDGGGSGDPFNNGQNKETLLGKMLRIDVDRDDFAGDPNRDYAIPADNPFAGATPGADEIWAYGLRNPWRASFDRLTGDLYIGDVGQSEREEINFQPAASDGGENYGWKVKEGSLVFNDTIPGNPSSGDPSLVDPVAEYGHAQAPDGGFAVTGGYVYRGTAAGMQGLYFYADFVTSQMWSFRVVDGVAVDVTNRTSQVRVDAGTFDRFSSFAEDGRGNLYAVGYDGHIHRLDPGAGAGDGADTLSGGAGSDKLFGGAGADLLLGGSGNDWLLGGIGNDTLRAASGNDNLRGGEGADFLTGAGGNDRMIGGPGADVFFFARGYGRDTVVDFANDIDTLQLASSLGVASASEALARASNQNGAAVFNFAGGEMLVVRNVAKAALADDILIV